MKQIFFLTFFSISCCLSLSAQERLQYWSNGEAYLQDQAAFVFEKACNIFDAYPPVIHLGEERMLAMLSLDALLHDTRLDGGVAFRSYMKNIIGKQLAKLQQTKVPGKNLRVFRFYNHGFIIKSPTVTIGIDLVRGGHAANPFINDTLMRSVVEQCDILFITHAHGDHADAAVVRMFCEQGKTVVVPEEIWKDMPPQFRVLRGTDMIRETIPVSPKNISLSVRVYPGHQGKVLNNVYLITLPEGQTIAHTGDQDCTDDMVAKVGAHKIDILFVQCWMMPMEKMIAGVKPALIFTGHENEMGHTIDHREAYWLTFRRMKNINVPYVAMAWGEFYTVPAER